MTIAEYFVTGREHRDDVDVLARRLLRGALAKRVARGLAGDDEHRDAVCEGAGHAGHEVGGAGARRAGADREASADAGVPVGHEGGALLVLAHDQTDAVVVLDRLEERMEQAAGDTEDDADAFRLEIVQKDVDHSRRGLFAKRLTTDMASQVQPLGGLRPPANGLRPRWARARAESWATARCFARRAVPTRPPKSTGKCAS